jgi:hypothetical protein
VKLGVAVPCTVTMVFAPSARAVTFPTTFVSAIATPGDANKNAKPIQRHFMNGSSC